MYICDISGVFCDILGTVMITPSLRVRASTEDIRNDWVEEISAAIEKEKKKGHNGAFHEEPKIVAELHGDVAPVWFPDDLADFCQVKRTEKVSLMKSQLIAIFRQKCVPQGLTC